MGTPVEVYTERKHVTLGVQNGTFSLVLTLMQDGAFICLQRHFLSHVKSLGQGIHSSEAKGYP